MQEAAELCNRVAFVVDGKVKALDTPHNLIMKKGAGKIYYSYISNGNEWNCQIFNSYSFRENWIFIFKNNCTFCNIYNI